MKLHTVSAGVTRFCSIGKNRCAVQRKGQLSKDGKLFFLCPDADCSRINLLIWNYFTEHKEFEKREKEKYVTDLHKNNQVLDVLSGKVVNIDSIQFADTRICAIDQECYYPHGDRSSLIITDYFVYELKDMGIENINPYQRPFCDIKSAFMFFQHNKKKDRYSQRLLLLNRKELYLVRDYRHLLAIAL